jgi:hypothetical protein
MIGGYALPLSAAFSRAPTDAGSAESGRAAR